MIPLGRRQEDFSRKIMLLMMHIHALGYSIRGGHWLRCLHCPIGHRLSNHKKKLAWDIILSISPAHGIRARVLTGNAAKKAHSKIHDYADSIGLAKRITGDLNHYSDEYQGMR